MFKWKSQALNQGIAAQELGQVLSSWVKRSQDDDAVESSDITFKTGGAEPSEMLRVAPDGFWVRGQRVPVDDREAETVYRAFREWLTWSHLTR